MDIVGSIWVCALTRAFHSSVFTVSTVVHCGVLTSDKSTLATSALCIINHYGAKSLPKESITTSNSSYIVNIISMIILHALDRLMVYTFW